MTDTNQNFTKFLRMMATDFEESGSDATAEDYRNAAQVIDELFETIAIKNSVIEVLQAENDNASTAFVELQNRYQCELQKRILFTRALSEFIS